MKLAVLDYGLGNLHSVLKALKHVVVDMPFDIYLAENPEQLKQADRVVFPGVGACRDAMQGLADRNLVDAFHICLKNKPVMGICVGMQVLFESSDEDQASALGYFKGRIQALAPQIIDCQDELGLALKIPHMGWNAVKQTQAHPLWQKIPDLSPFYFVHSYAFLDTQNTQVLGTSEHGTLFSSVVGHENCVAVQFHPEKSQAAGLQCLANFLSWSI